MRTLPAPIELATREPAPRPGTALGEPGSGATPAHDPSALHGSGAAPPAAGGASDPLHGLGLLVAPSTGRFRPAALPRTLIPGSVVGHVTGGRGRADAIVCPAAGTVRGLLVRPGQHVTQGQAVIWIEQASDQPIEQASEQSSDQPIERAGALSR